MNPQKLWKWDRWQGLSIPKSFPQKEQTAAGPGLWKVLGQSGNSGRGQLGGCREMLDCAWILCPALFFAGDLFLKSFILIKVSLGLRGLCV